MIKIDRSNAWFNFLKGFRITHGKQATEAANTKYSHKEFMHRAGTAYGKLSKEQKNEIAKEQPKKKVPAPTKKQVKGSKVVEDAVVAKKTVKELKVAEDLASTEGSDSEDEVSTAKPKKATRPRN